MTNPADVLTDTNVVYVVHSGHSDWESSSITGVFSTEDAAKAQASQFSIGSDGRPFYFWRDVLRCRVDEPGDGETIAHYGHPQ